MNWCDVLEKGVRKMKLKGFNMEAGGICYGWVKHKRDFYNQNQNQVKIDKSVENSNVVDEAGWILTGPGVVEVLIRW